MQIKKCFTLIELFVVVAIIGILASLLMPALSSARAKGKSAVCISNLKQLGLANHSYASDEDDSLPIGIMDTNNNGNHDLNVDPDGYDTALAGQMDYAVSVFECPGFSVGNFNGNQGKKAIVDPDGNEHFAYRTYRPNNFRSGNIPGGDNRWKNGLIKFNFSFKINEIANDTILDGDYVRGYSYANLGGPGYWDRRGASFGNHDNKSSNLLFIDGSARYFSMKSFLSNTEIYFGNGTTFSVENNSNNLGLFSANMAPQGTFWTVVDD